MLLIHCKINEQLFIDEGERLTSKVNNTRFSLGYSTTNENSSAPDNSIPCGSSDSILPCARTDTQHHTCNLRVTSPTPHVQQTPCHHLLSSNLCHDTTVNNGS
jgi:hypothetical protein